MENALKTEKSEFMTRIIADHCARLAAYEKHRRDPMYEQVGRKIQAVASGRTSPADLTGSTSVRLAVGLALDCLSETNPTVGSDRRDAWERLNAVQRAAVADYNPDYLKPEWEDIPVYYL